MKKTLTTLLILLSMNALSLEFSAFPPAGFEYPDFNDYRQAQNDFVEDVEKLRASDEVKAYVQNVEETYNTTCYATKESRGFKWYKLGYMCEGEKNFRMSVKARFKKGKILVK